MSIDYIVGNGTVTLVTDGGGSTLASNATGNGTITLSGDVTGASNSNTVTAISGSSPILITPAMLQWTAATVSPSIVQATQTSDLATNTTTISAQSAFATATTNVTGGSLNLAAGLGATSGTNYQSGNVVVQLGAPGGTGVEAALQVTRSGTVIASIGTVPVLGASYAGLWLGPGISPSSTNSTLIATTTSTYLNGNSTLSFSIAGSNKLVVNSTYIGTLLPVGGYAGNVAFSWASTSQALTSGTSNVLANTVYNSPRIKFTGTLTGTGTTITLPATEGAFWILDFDGVTFSSNTISLIANSNTWGTTISALTTVVLIYYIGSEGKLYGTSLSA
jgi:hypothetical protein